MPLPKGTRYRRKGKMRYAWYRGKLIEVKNMDTGATHTPAEFAADRKRKAKKKRSTAKRKK